MRRTKQKTCPLRHRGDTFFVCLFAVQSAEGIGAFTRFPADFLISQPESVSQIGSTLLGELLIFAVYVADMPDHIAELAESVGREPLAVLMFGIHPIHPDFQDSQRRRSDKD